MVVRVKHLQPDVVLLIMSLPDTTPINACRSITTLSVSPVSEEEVATSLMLTAGHLPKGDSLTDFLRGSAPSVWVTYRTSRKWPR